MLLTKYELDKFYNFEVKVKETNTEFYDLVILKRKEWYIPNRKIVFDRSKSRADIDGYSTFTRTRSCRELIDQLALHYHPEADYYNSSMINNYWKGIKKQLIEHEQKDSCMYMSQEIDGIDIVFALDYRHSKWLLEAHDEAERLITERDALLKEVETLKQEKEDL